MNKNIFFALFLCLAFSTANAFGYTKEDVEKRGILRCGVSNDSPGFSIVDKQGVWSGLDVDFCRAVAAATLGTAEKVKFIPLDPDTAYTALLSGEVDLLSRQSTWTFTRDSALAVHFTGVSFYDGLGILAAANLGAKQIKDLKKIKVCNPVGSASGAILKDYLQREKMAHKMVPYDSEVHAVKGFESGDCNFLSLPRSKLYGIQFELGEPESALVLPEVIAKEPFGPVVRHGDDTWFNIVKWTLFAMVNAEELGITSKNIEEMRLSHSLAIRRLLGLEGSGGKGLGLRNDWVLEVVRQVGNYGEIYERNLGVTAQIKIDRGLNRLWKDGGLQYAPPFR